ncbi:MAG TPA: nitroreductase family deazaflavin-dependent oxidoreductase [Ktedonosporobacter sp.]|nr:nitroreductase family deazaflavin-dependent oxidoreductase [Ktedonosporobacter sp.]
MSTQPGAETKRRTSRGASSVQRFFIGTSVLLYRLSGGAIGGRMGKAPLLLLTTTGRKSGKRYTTPVLYLVDGDRWVVVGSYAGAPMHPGWWLNLKANPRAEIEVGRQKVQVTAAQASAEERTRLWPLLTEMYPRYNDYQKKTSREMPVGILTRVE